MRIEIFKDYKRSLIFILKLGIGFSLFFLSLYFNNLSLHDVLTSYNVTLLGILFVIQLFIFILSISRWILVLKWRDLSINFSTALHIGFKGSFFAFIGPTLVTTDFLKNAYLKKQGAPKEERLRIFAFDRGGAFASLMIFLAFVLVGLQLELKFSYFLSLLILFPVVSFLYSSYAYGIYLVSSSIFLLKALGLTLIIYFASELHFPQSFYQVSLLNIIESFNLTPLNLGVGHLAFDFTVKDFFSNGVIGYNYYFLSRVFFRLFSGWVFLLPKTPST